MININKNKLIRITLISQIIVILFVVIFFMVIISSFKELQEIVNEENTTLTNLNNELVELNADINELKLNLSETKETIKNIQEENVVLSNNLKNQYLDLLRSNLKNSYISAFSKNNNIEYNQKICDTYYDILTSKISFKNDYFDEKVLLNQIYFDENLVKAQRYSLVDMNKDSIPELVVIASPNDYPDYVLIILYNFGDVVSYFFSNRQIGDIKVDGTFHSSGGAGNIALNEIKFTEDGYEYKTLAESVSGIDKNNYYIDDIQVTEEEWEEVFSNYLQKEELIWFEFPKNMYDF